MGLFDFIKKDSIKEQRPKTKYEHIPLVNPQEGKMSPKGYVERKFITQEYVHGKIKNIFKDSGIPIVKDLDYINNDLDTLILQEKLGQKVRSTNEYFYYIVPENHQKEFVHIISLLNTEIMKHELPKQYLINLDEISFREIGMQKYPRSGIKYYPDKNEFDFYFSDSKLKKRSSTSVDPWDEYNTEYGHIFFDENGLIKKAEFNKKIKKERIKEVFKMYKTGFELYQITYMGKIIYKRNN